MYMHEGYVGWYGSFMMGIMSIGMILIFVIVIAAAISVFRSSGRPHDHSLNILKENYAKGNISDEEFERKKEHLRAK